LGAEREIRMALKLNGSLGFSKKLKISFKTFSSWQRAVNGVSNQCEALGDDVK
jgi:hypothetical protein